MKEFFYQELKNNIEQISNIKNAEAKKELDKMLLNIVETIHECHYVVLKQGLLALEDYQEKIKKERSYWENKKYMIDFIEDMLDGMDIKYLEDIGYCRYCSTGFTDYDALSYLMIFTGMMDIYSGINPLALEKKLKNMLPSHFLAKYNQIKELKEAPNATRSDDHGNHTGFDRTVIDRICAMKIGLSPSDDGYQTVKELDEILSRLDDRAIQWYLRFVDNRDLSSTLIGLSEDVRRRLLNNLSERLALMVATDTEYMIKDEPEDIGKASKRMRLALQEQIDAGEIVLYNGDL